MQHRAGRFQLDVRCSHRRRSTFALPRLTELLTRAIQVSFTPQAEGLVNKSHCFSVDVHHIVHRRTTFAWGVPNSTTITYAGNPEASDRRVCSTFSFARLLTCFVPPRMISDTSNRALLTRRLSSGPSHQSKPVR